MNQPLSQARRFVLGGQAPIADGVIFGDGVVVVRSRLSPGVEIYPEGLAGLPEVVRADVVWIDAVRSWPGGAGAGDWRV